MTEIKIALTWKEWMSIQKFIGESKSSLGQTRKRFNSGFVELINSKISYLANSCTIGQGHNWFRKEDSQRNKTSPFWSGKFKCKDRNCDSTITLTIQNIFVDLEVEISVKFSKITNHQKVAAKTICQGNARDEQKLLLIAKGTSNSINENLVHNFEQPEKGLFSCLQILTYFYY